MSSSVRNALVDLSEIHECSYLLVRLFRFIVDSHGQRSGAETFLLGFISTSYLYHHPLPHPQKIEKRTASDFQVNICSQVVILNSFCMIQNIVASHFVHWCVQTVGG